MGAQGRLQWARIGRGWSQTAATAKEKLEGFIVASAFEKMGQPLRNGAGEGCYQYFNTLRNFAQTLHVLVWITPALFVRNNFQPVSQCLGQFGLWFRHCFRGSPCLGRAEARPSVCSLFSS